MTAAREPSRLRRILLAAIIAIVAAPFFPGVGADPDELPPGARVIPHRRDDPDRYQNFVVNWDAGAEVLCAVVRTPADYARLFHPAPVIDGRKPFAPPDATFEKEQLLAIAHVVGGDGGSALKIARVVENGGVLEVHFDRPAPHPSTFSVKEAALVWIPHRAAERVTFVESGKTVATLDPAGGEWISPALQEASPAPE